MTTILGLRPNLASLLDVIHTHYATHDVMPTSNQLAAARGISQSSVSSYLSVLASRGWVRLERRNGSQQGRLTITLTDKPWPGAA